MNVEKVIKVYPTVYSDYRLEWEHTIDDMSVLEKVDDDTLIFLQVKLLLFIISIFSFSKIKNYV
jgi:hypothetical protein